MQKSINQKCKPAMDNGIYESIAGVIKCSCGSVAVLDKKRKMLVCPSRLGKKDESLCAYLKDACTIELCAGDVEVKKLELEELVTGWDVLEDSYPSIAGFSETLSETQLAAMNNIIEEIKVSFMRNRANVLNLLDAVPENIDFDTDVVIDELNMKGYIVIKPQGFMAAEKIRDNIEGGELIGYSYHY